MLVRFFLPSTSIPTKVWLALRLPMCLIIQPEPSAIEIRQATQESRSVSLRSVHDGCCLLQHVMRSTPCHPEGHRVNCQGTFNLNGSMLTCTVSGHVFHERHELILMNWHHAATLLILTLTASYANADWPQWRGPNRNGYVATGDLIESLPKAGLAAKWQFDSFAGGNSGGWSSPVISDGRVYLFSHTKTKNSGTDLAKALYPWLPPEKRVGMSDQEYQAYEVKRRDENEKRSKAFRFEERLVCLELETGDVVWDRALDSTYTRFVQSGTPCVSNGKVFVLGAARTARCYDAATGNVLWQTRLPGDFRDEFFASSFTVAGHFALVACGPLVALNVTDGAVVWQGDAELDYQSHSSPAIWQAGDIDLVIANTSGGRTQAYQVADGRKLWELKAGVGQSTPIVVGNRMLLYGSSRKSGLTAFQLDPQTVEQPPSQLWQFQRAADSGSTPVVRHDAVFVQGEKRLAKVRLSDGDPDWQTTMKISNPRYTSLIAAGDQVFFGWEGLLAFQADGDRFHKIYEAKIDAERRLIATGDLREKLQANATGTEAGAEAVEKRWQKNAVATGPLACSTPAISGGLIVFRLRNAVVCYDLRK